MAPFVVPTAQLRFARTRAGEANFSKADEEAQKASEAGQQAQEGSADGKAQQEQQQANQPPPPPGGIRGHIAGLKSDFVEFPEIYNSANAINFVLFTVFCLCSTGSAAEADFWLDYCGIDSAFRPSAWFLHSILMNNFLTMTFAMILMHTMCHSVIPTLGSKGLFKYCAIVSLTCGVAMWMLNAAMKNNKEKQHGPWDVVAALFVMQYLHQGFTPLSILASFSGWIKYANFVGAACILYYDWQPTLFGTLAGVVLCRTVFKGSVVAAAAH